MTLPRQLIAADGSLDSRSETSLKSVAPSRTAMITAAARAIATHDPDPSVRNPDWLAEHFLGTTERKLLAGTPWSDALDYDYRDIGRHSEIDTLVRGSWSVRVSSTSDLTMPWRRALRK